ncbi:quinone oxidoreductase-like protein 2 isoform 6 [Mus musculus]|uniref:quinone oxidoreductase-like protein 2 isoform 6 n=1 Tax=Mus musculus TaxID=10090 RepID=UPI0024AEE807|nr:quinone oxidoreductase-like protein 2 isoform 6 [Mus musculus]
MAARLCTRCLPPVWLCRQAWQGQGRHYRAALCTELKQPLTIQEVAPRPVGPQEVRVDVHFCGVNFADILACRGQYQEKPPLPFTPGMEFSGAVLETGTDVSTVKKGDRVIGVSSFHAMAEQCITDQKTLWRIPENVSLQDAAVLPVSYGTAILAVDHRARIQPGETVLVTAAAGATGLAVIDVATNVFRAKGSEEEHPTSQRKVLKGQDGGSYSSSASSSKLPSPLQNVASLELLAILRCYVLCAYQRSTMPSFM